MLVRVIVCGMIWIWIVLLGVLLLGAWFLLPYMLRRLAEQRLDRLCRAKRAIVLSYDDGPGPVLTPQLLRLLDEHKARATFFILGRNADAAPELVAQMQQAGHEIGSHTYDHTNAWKAGPLQAARDLAKGISLTRRMGGDGGLFRPPFGKLTLAGLIDGALRGLRYGWWTIDSRDSWDRRPVEDVLAEIETQQGGVVLMHDFDSYSKGISEGDVSHTDHVLALTARILEFARAHDFHVLPLGAVYQGSDR